MRDVIEKQRGTRRAVGVGAVFCSIAAFVAGAVTVAPQRDGKRPVGPVPETENTYLVASNQMVTPAGRVVTISGARPKDTALSPDGKTLAVLTQSGAILYAMDDGAELGSVRLGQSAGPLGIAWTPDGSAVLAAQGDGKVARLARSPEGKWSKASDFAVDAARPAGAGTGDSSTGQAAPKGNPQVAGLAVSPDGKRLYVALGIRNAIAVVSLPEGIVTQTVPVGVSPYRITLSADGNRLFVANRGGRAADKDEPSADSAGTPVRVHRRTDAALSGSVSIIDTQTLSVSHSDAGRQPSAIAATKDGRTLYIASSDDDTVIVSQERGNGRRENRVIPLRPAEDPGFGQIPTDLVLSADEKTLYVACGGANAVALVDTARRRVTGWVPTGWYPIALEERGGALAVACSKGFGSRVRRANGSYGVHGTVGTVQFLTSADYADGARLSRQVAENNRWGMATELRPRRGIKPVPVPERVGEPSVFEHVVFIIKENQTYDSIMGDIPEGNGDRALCLFPEEVTPNHHALARQFVLLDNTYTSGTNSADGHQWTVSSVANGYIEQNYSANARSYPYDGGDPLAYSPEGFLWTAATQAKKSVRVYGEFVNRPRIVDKTTGKPGGTWTELWKDYTEKTGRFEITAETDNAALRPHLHPNYIGFPSRVSDQWRADQFVADVDRFEKEGKMPDLSILLLPNDHTAGTSPRMPTPRAAVADNDLALGRIVERLSKSKFWPKMLILVIQDDSQLGVDHVDGHRTTAFCISPYTRRGAVVSDTYNHPSFIRTMGLVLGMKPMNRFDRTANPLTACFTPTPDARPYTALPNRIPLDEMNPPAAALRGRSRQLALASEKLDWSDVDRADAPTVAQAVWNAQKPGKPFPWKHFHPNEDAEDEEE